MDIQCFRCGIYLGTATFVHQYNVVKIEIQCNECNKEHAENDHFERAKQNCGRNDLLTMGLEDFIGSKTPMLNYETLDMRDEDLNRPGLLSMIENRNLSTIQSLIISVIHNTTCYGTSCDDFITALGRNRTLISLKEISVYGRRFSPHIFCLFRENIKFDKPLIRDGKVTHAMMSIASITIIHNNEELKDLGPYDTGDLTNSSKCEYKVIYTYNGRVTGTDRVRLHLFFDYNQYA